jgi:Na+/melibiose symporter-like transporter
MGSNWDDAKITSDDFLLNFIGFLLGIGITIVTFIYSTFDKFRDSLIRLNIDKSKVDKASLQLKKCFNAIKKDLLTVFVIFLLCIFIIIFKNCNIPYIEWKSSFLSKNEFVHWMKLSMLFFTLIGVFDIMYSLFTLMKAEEEMP